MASAADKPEKISNSLVSEKQIACNDVQPLLWLSTHVLPKVAVFISFKTKITLEIV